jgi:uncharacterized membrane protein
MNEEPLFEAVLSPHRSLGRLGFVLLMSVVTVITAVHMVIFARVGAWPVFAFFGLDLALLFGAFWLSYRSGPDARIRQRVAHGPRGEARSRLRDGPLNIGSTRSGHASTSTGMRRSASPRCRSAAKAKRPTSASFLNPDDKESFASAFQRALATIKR